VSDTKHAATAVPVWTAATAATAKIAIFKFYFIIIIFFVED